MYNIDNCPNLNCKDCLFWGKNCKRLGGTKIEFARPWFCSQDNGNHIICNSFEPKHPEYTDLKDWTNFEDFWEVYKQAWLPYGNENTDCAFTINGDKSIRYYVPLKSFIDGTMIKDGELQSTHKKYYKRTQEGFGYKLITEKIEKEETMEVKLNGNFEDIKLFKIHADYRPLNIQKTTNYYYVYGWKKSEVCKYFKNKVSWLKIFNIEVCSDEERKFQEEKPLEKKIIMNESNYLRIKEYLEKNNEGQ